MEVIDLSRIILSPASFIYLLALAVSVVARRAVRSGHYRYVDPHSDPGRVRSVDSRCVRHSEVLKYRFQ